MEPIKFRSVVATVILALVAFAAIVAVVVYAKNAIIREPAAAPAPVTTTVTVTTAPSSTSSQVAELDAMRDAAFNYYMSPERRVLLQQVLDTEGMRIARDLLAQRIPSSKRGWEKGDDSVAPVNGYGVLESVPHSGEPTDKPYVGVVVHFNDGRVDLSGGVLSLFIIKGDIVYDLTGARSLNNRQQPIENTPVSYDWNRSQPDAGFYISHRDTPGNPNWEEPLDPNTRYTIHSYTINDIMSPVTVGDIKTEDAAFIAEITGLNVNGSDWN